MANNEGYKKPTTLITASVSIILMVLAWLTNTLYKIDDEKADKELVNKEINRVDHRINEEKEQRKHNDNLIRDEQDRLKDKDDFRNIK